MEQNGSDQSQKDAIKIPNHLLDGAINEQVNAEDGPETEARPMDGFVTDLAEKSVEKLAGAFDEVMREKGGVGLAGISEKDFAKLGVVALEDMIPKEVLENSPKAAFGVMCTYIAGANAVAIKRNKAKQPEQNQDSTDAEK